MMWEEYEAGRRFVEHGGNLAAAESRFGVPAQGWLDLSTGINPHSYPLPKITPDAWVRLPDDGVMSTLLDAARVGYGVGDGADIVAAPGTQAIIQWLPRIRATGSVTILGPTYGEHARAWLLAGHQVHVIEDASDDQLAALRTDVIIVVNPNNPDGRVVPLDLLRTIADQRALRGGLLIVDCAFADVCQPADATPIAGRAGLVVLRSFGKFYGLAGVRLGFALMDASGGKALRSAMGPWAVNGPSAIIASHALMDTTWRDQMRAWLTDEAGRLDDVLTANGLTVVGGTSLYRLAEIEDAGALFAHLAGHGILVRPFADRAHRLRFGLAGTTEDLARLTQALGGYKR